MTLTLKKLEWKEIKAPAPVIESAASKAAAPKTDAKSSPAAASISGLETKGAPGSDGDSSSSSSRSSSEGAESTSKPKTTAATGAATDAGLAALASPAWTIAWLDLADARIWGGMRAHQRINQFPGMEQLSRKKNLGDNLMLLASHKE